MKKLFFFFLVLLTAVLVNGQTKKTQALISEIEGQWSTDENKNLTYQKVVEMPGIGKDILYQRSENYFIYNYGSGKDVIQTKDKEQGLIIGKGLWPGFYVGITFGTMTYSANHILRVDVKDEKARITLTVQSYDLLYSDGKNTNEYTLPIGSMFPINSESTTKTMDGKAFYNLHFKCIAAIETVINSLKNDAIQTTKTNNW